MGDSGRGRIWGYCTEKDKLRILIISLFDTNARIVGFVSLAFAFLTQMQNPMMGDAHTKSYLRTSNTKRENILSLTLRYDATSCCLCYHWKG